MRIATAISPLLFLYLYLIIWIGGMMEIAFEGLIKQLTLKSLVSLDKVGRLTIDFNGENPEIIDGLNRLMKADREVQIKIKDL